MRRILLALALTMPMATKAEVVTISSDKSVSEAVAAFTMKVEQAGAKVFAVVDHGAGATSIGQDIGASQLVIFGNPKVGTPAMQVSPLAGLGLPLKVLFYETAEGTRISYESPADSLKNLTGADFPPEITKKMAGALKNLTAAAQ